MPGITLRFNPLEFIKHTLLRPPLFEEKARYLPSGDQEGDSAPPASKVSCMGLSPFTPMENI
jgi:hypothetical protein